jgi:methylase of polypeptide subunit release factors
LVNREEALLELLGELKSRDYRFTCVTPATHERILLRPFEGPPTLRDIFGWNRSLSVDDIDPRLLELLRLADCVETAEATLRSKLRVASLDDGLFLHSSFPTDAQQSVFFGPDTYRFVRFIRSKLPTSALRIVDMGAGSGAGAIAIAPSLPRARVTLVDVNPKAAELARVNARFAQVPADVLLSQTIPRGCDLVIANPPYMIDPARRAYRDGGRMLGAETACRWLRQAIAALVPGGTMLLYTGAAFSRGRSPLVEQLGQLEASAIIEIEEIDPDVFGEELDRIEYREVERIAALGISVRKQAHSTLATTM